jgi:hypothetical protein
VKEQKGTSLEDFLTNVGTFAGKQQKHWNKVCRKNGDRESVRTHWWHPWFRGEEQAGWDSALVPKLYRYNGIRSGSEELVPDDPENRAGTRKGCKNALLHEQEMRAEFRRRGGVLITEQQPVDKWQWYFLMQHYGAPTRLLDWTDFALLAVYFAVCPRNNDKEKYHSVDASKECNPSVREAAVYMLDPWWLNERAFKDVDPRAKPYRSMGVALLDWEEVDPYLPPDEFDNEELGPICPLAIAPPHFSRRIAAQQSQFTIFGRKKNKLKDLADKEDGTCNICKEAHYGLVKFTMNADAIDRIKDHLRLIGISEVTAYPDLEGLGRDLTYLFKEYIQTRFPRPFGP